MVSEQTVLSPELTQKKVFQLPPQPTPWTCFSTPLSVLPGSPWRRSSPGTQARPANKNLTGGWAAHKSVTAPSTSHQPEYHIWMPQVHRPRLASSGLYPPSLFLDLQPAAKSPTKTSWAKSLLLGPFKGRKAFMHLSQSKYPAIPPN